MTLGTPHRRVTVLHEHCLIPLPKAFIPSVVTVFVICLTEPREGSANLHNLRTERVHPEFGVRTTGYLNMGIIGAHTV